MNSYFFGDETNGCVKRACQSATKSSKHSAVNQ